MPRPLHLRVFGCLEALVPRRGQIPVGVSANRLRADFFEALQDFLGFRSIQTQIAGGNDCIRATLRVKIGQTGVETDEISVNVGKNGYTHKQLVALERERKQRRGDADLLEVVEIYPFDDEARFAHARERRAIADVGDDVTVAQAQHARRAILAAR